jgi:hypothetical protein
MSRAAQTAHDVPGPTPHEQLFFGCLLVVMVFYILRRLGYAQRQRSPVQPDATLLCCCARASRRLTRRTRTRSDTKASGITISRKKARCGRGRCAAVPQADAVTAWRAAQDDDSSEDDMDGDESSDKSE